MNKIQLNTVKLQKNTANLDKKWENVYSMWLISITNSERNQKNFK